MRRKTVASIQCLLALVLLILSACTTEPERGPVARVAGGDAARGPELLSAYGCTSCHVIPGIRGADATIGPPLTDWGERWYIAGLLVNEPDNLMHFIQAPQSVKPGVAMPDMGVTTSDARDMAAYLYTLVDGGYSTAPAEGTPAGAPAAPPAEGTPSGTPTGTLTGTPAASPVEGTPGGTPTAEAEATGEQELIALGESVYDQNCARCHGGQGDGAGGAYPALAGNDFVTGEPERVIEIVVHGRGAMPAFGGELSDREIAAVISYIRNTWGNAASRISPDDVGAAR